MACTRGNLGDRAQNTRMRMGLIFLGLALLVAVWLIKIDASPFVRALLFIPFFAASFGAYQGLFRTCTYAAKLGVRESDAGVVPIADPNEILRARKDGRFVMISSFATALAATLVIVLIP